MLGGSGESGDIERKSPTDLCLDAARTGEALLELGVRLLDLSLLALLCLGGVLDLDLPLERDLLLGGVRERLRLELEGVL